MDIDKIRLESIYRTLCSRPDICASGEGPNHKLDKVVTIWNDIVALAVSTELLALTYYAWIKGAQSLLQA